MLILENLPCPVLTVPEVAISLLLTYLDSESGFTLSLSLFLISFYLGVLFFSIKLFDS